MATHGGSRLVTFVTRRLVSVLTFLGISTSLYGTSHCHTYKVEKRKVDKVLFICVVAYHVEGRLFRNIVRHEKKFAGKNHSQISRISQNNHASNCGLVDGSPAETTLWSF